MQRLVFEFQKTCDNNLSFDTFRHKIENQLRTNERQKIQLDSLLGLENIKRIQEKKKREELKQKKEEMEKKKKEDEEKQKRREERAKKKKEEEQKKKEEENKAGVGSSTQNTTNSATNQTNPATNQANNENRNPLALNSSQPLQQSDVNLNKSNNDDLKNNNKSADPLKDQNKQNQDDKNTNTSMVSNTSSVQEKKDQIGAPNEDKLDISQGDMSVLIAMEEEAKKKKLEAEEKNKKKEEEKKEDSQGADKPKDQNEQQQKVKKEEDNIGEAIMKNEQYETFKKFNKMVREDRITVPETFLPDVQMKIQRQKAMNQVIELDPQDLEYLNQELSSVRQTFEHFRKLVETIKRLDSKVELIEKNEGNYLIVSEDDILEFIKDYLETNEIAGMFLKNEIVRQTPFFEDFFEKIIKYLDTLSNMLKKRFFAFAKIEENCLTINYSYLKNTLKKFSTPTLNLSQILKDIYTDLNSQILKYMLNDTVFLFETPEEDAQIIKYNRSEDEFKINSDSTIENIREYMDVFRDNSVKYFQVLLSLSKIIPTTPLESKLEELQDFLENKIETLMKATPQHFQKPPVLEILKEFDDKMNKLHEAFVFDMKGMAENIETTQLEETLKKRLLSLKNQMYTQMKALKDCSDQEDYNFFQEIILEHFLNINKETQKVIEKKKGNQNKRSCLEVIVMNYQLLSSLVELFESESENKTQIHYNYLYSTVKAVKEYFQSFIDLDAVQQDELILQKALHTFTDIQFLECSLFDSLSKF